MKYPSLPAFSAALAAIAMCWTTAPRIQAATVWDGPLTTYTQPGTNPSLAANQDRITPSVWITRAATQGIFNAQTETVFAHFSSPSDTEWANGTLANFASLSYSDWNTWAKNVNGGPKNTVGVNAVVHLISEDIYIGIKFTLWGGSAGKFAYQRTTAPAAVQPPSITSQPSSRVAAPGSSPAFSVTASTFTGTTNYQWQFNSTNLPGKTTATLTLANVQLSSFGPYRVIVSDGTTSVTSSVAQLTLALSPTIARSISGTSLSLSYPTEIGPGYVLEYKTNLGDLSWTTLTNNAGIGSTVTTTDSLTAASRRFYRVRLQ